MSRGAHHMCECPSKFLGKIQGIWLVGGSFFPLGQGLEG
jgi:hypothetical protein